MARYTSYIYSKETNEYVQIMRSFSKGIMDYDELGNQPILNVYGNNHVYVDISSLESGRYNIVGKYKFDDQSEMYDAISPFEVVVTEDAITHDKVASFITIEDGKYVVHVLHFQDSDVTSIEHNIIGDSIEIDNKIAHVEEQISSINDDINGINNVIGNHNTRIQENTQSISNVNNDLTIFKDATNSKLSTIENNINDIQFDVSDNSSDISTINQTITTLQGNENIQGSVKNTVNSAISAFDNTLSTIAKSGLASDVNITDTSNKFAASNVEGVLSELDTKINNFQTQSNITVSVAQTPDQGDASTYIIKQGNTEKGKIHLAKDLVATSGELTSVDGQGNEGTFIKLTIANGTPFYIPVQDLIDVYVGSGDRSTITTGIDVKIADGVVSAEIKSVDGALIDQKTITLDKFTQNIQDKLAHIQDIDEHLATIDSLLTWKIYSGSN